MLMSAARVKQAKRKLSRRFDESLLMEVEAIKVDNT
jgi:6-pyruvoyl-tetrahydropterin synthase